MASDIRNAALNLGYINALPVTGHPFIAWRERLMDTALERLSKAHDPAIVSGWPLDEITIWVAIAPNSLVESWPEGCGEIGAYYMSYQMNEARRIAWEDEAVAMGYEVVRGAFLPERAAAIRAGLGVQGLNGLMIAPEYGSFVTIAVLLVRTSPPQDARGPEYDLAGDCGNCGICIDACPSGAISENGLNAEICLRTYMIKLDKFPEEDYPKIGKRILGCDTCQHVCPSNGAIKKEQLSAEMTDYMKLEELLTKPTLNNVLGIKYLNETFVKSQAVLAAANTGRKDLLPLVEALIGSEDKTLSKMAQWSADRLRRVS